MTTRQFGLVLTVAFLVVLAGCAGSGGTPTPTASGDDDGSDVEETPTEADADGTAASATPTATPTPTPTATPTPTPTPNASAPSTPTPTPEPLPRMSELLELGTSYRYTAEIQGEEGTTRQEGRWYETDFVAELTLPGQDRTFTVYNVDDREAYLTDGECFSQNVPPAADPGNWSEADYLTEVDVRPSSTTTIDGEKVYVYESDSGHPELDGPFTYYVSAETGHLLRQESANAWVDLFDWGHDESVELPC